MDSLIKSASDGISAILRVASGIAKASKSENFDRASQLARSAIRNRFIDELRDQWESLKSSGTVASDFENSEIGRSALREMLEFLDDGDVDSRTYGFVSGVFFRLSAATADELQDVLAIQLLRTARHLSSDEIAVLVACHKISLERRPKAESHELSYDDWGDRAADESGLAYLELAQIAHSKLRSLRLVHGSNSQTSIHFDSWGLTSWGRRLVQYAIDGEAMARPR